jgi:glycosyltransferase involved in cell wall biosynthesis
VSGSLRVGLLHFTAPPIVGGVEAIIGRQAAGLLARGHRVTVIAGRGGGFRHDVEFKFLPALDSKYPPLLDLNRTLVRGCVRAAFAELSAELEAALGRLLRDLDICVVHNALTLHFNLPLTAALHRLAAAGLPSGMVAWCHDLSWSNPLYAPLLYDAYPWHLLKRRAAQTTYVVVSEDRRHDLARLAGIAPDELMVIPAGVDLAQKWALGRATVHLLAEYDLLEADPFILLPVRITRRKNIEYAIRVTGRLRDLGLRPKLLVTGPRGPHDAASIGYVRQLEALTAELGLGEEVILLQGRRRAAGRPWKPTDAMMDEFYRAADLMLLPSAQEGFGIPLLEAGVVGLPVFCSDIPPLREVAGPRSVEYFRLDDPPSELADRIAHFIRSDARYGLRKRVARQFNWETIFDRRLIPLLRAVSSERSGVGGRPAAFSLAGSARVYSTVADR